MGKSKQKYVILSGYNIHDNNRGTAALSYGCLAFLSQKHGLTNKSKIINIRYYKNISLDKYKDTINHIKLNDSCWEIETVYVFRGQKKLFDKFGILLPFSKLRKILKNLRYVAAINGGDGFSDIYGTKTFLSRLSETMFALKMKKPIIILPQTLGPFKQKSNYDLAKQILTSANYVYVRDDKFVAELDKIGVRYEHTNDLSYYMRPEPFDIEINDNAIGLNISGLAYSNTFRDLAGQFDNYPYLIKMIIKYFQNNTNATIYLISHSYNYEHPEPNNDDLEVSRYVYNKLENKKNVILIDQDLSSPKTKYVISRMNFFIGTRMHANYAAIFSKVPVFGLAYSYKFEGAFNKNGIYGQTEIINNISQEQADKIVEKIAIIYNKTQQ